MVTIYYDTRTVRVRMPVLTWGPSAGALLVRLQGCHEEGMATLASLRTERRARRHDRARRLDAASARAEAQQLEALRMLQGRGV